jgi:hypothetical protein
VIRSVVGNRVPKGEGRASQIPLSLPSSLAIFGQELYVADTGYHRVLKISLQSWKAEVVIGNGHPGSVGDGGPS